MQIRRLRISRFRAFDEFELCPGPVTVLIGPSGVGKSTVLAAIDLLLHPGLGRPRAVGELDFHGRDPSAGFEIEAVLGDLPSDIVADTIEHIEGWRAKERLLIPEPDGPEIEPVVRVRAIADADYEITHSFAKDESGGARFGARLRRRLGWVYDGGNQEAARELAFYQGTVLDRLFSAVDLSDPVGRLRAAITTGADDVTHNEIIKPVLEALGADLARLGLEQGPAVPIFEGSAISQRELLQTLRLSLPSSEQLHIPVDRHGRGTRRLLFVSALLRLSSARQSGTVAGFDEPEQALEPLRQSQLVELLRGVTTGGGQLFLATHSTDIVRGFTLDDLVLMPQPTQCVEMRTLAVPAKRHFERHLDGAVVRGLFCRVPLLVEGPSDRPVLEVFWRALADQNKIPSMTALGIDVINCEGAPKQPPMARLLNAAGKTVVAWAEQDVPDTLQKLRGEANCAALLLHDPNPERYNLERSLAWGTTLDALSSALTALAEDRDATWDEQQQDLLSRVDGAIPGRAVAKAATTLDDLLGALTEHDARTLVATALGAKSSDTHHPPFEMKGGRQGRLVAQAIVDCSGVPGAYAEALTQLATWVASGTSGPARDFVMADPEPAP